jgi:acetyl esterase/lipase
MESHADEVVLAGDTFRIYRSGKMDRLHLPERVPAGLDPATGVTSKDVVTDAGTGLSVRLFFPDLGARHPSSGKNKKLPVFVFFHGGAFLIESAVSELYHCYVASLAAAAGVLAVSVDYSLAPEHPVPVAYDDAWAALQWTVSAQDDWIAEHGDLGRLFLAGDSAGGNMVHNVLIRLASSEPAPRIEGAILLHPWFGGTALVEGEDEAKAKEMAAIWQFACPPGAVGGADDPRMNPMAPGTPGLENLRCERMLVCAGEEDWAAARDRAYYAALSESAWHGSAAWIESEGEGHVFFLLKPECEKAKELMDRVVSFVAGS